MNFTTPIDVDNQGFTLSYNNKILLVGSCFTENIGNKLNYFGFETLINPFGILYNPISIFKCLEITSLNQKIKESDLVQNNGLWHSWQHHSCFSSERKETCLNKCNQAIENANVFFQNTDTVVVTLGTANVYQLTTTGEIVGNCHKFPSTTFNKELLSIETQLQTIGKIIELLQQKKSNLRILFTISPIRHWRDGYRENQLSKSVLHLLVWNLQKKHKNTFYFPAYEILMDELRDYRFYDTDMLHPSAVAIEYCWEKFVKAYCNETTTNTMKLVDQWRKMSQHRPLFPKSSEYQKFLEKTQSIEKQIYKKLPYLKNQNINL